VKATRSILIIIMAAFTVVSCGIFFRPGPVDGNDFLVDPSLPPIPPDWERILEQSTLPLLQDNLSGDASSAWIYANAVLGGEVWILDSKENPESADEFLTNPSLLSPPIGPTGWPTSLPADYSVTLSSYYSRKTETPAGALRSTEYESLTGIYVVTWKGQTLPDPDNGGAQQFWILDTQNDGDPDEGTQILPAGDHRAIAKVRTGHRGVNVRYREPDPADPIRDIKLWTPTGPGAGLTEVDMSAYLPETMGKGMLSAYCTEPAPGAAEPLWHPLYLQHLASDPSGVIRFMGFLNINGLQGQAALDWEDRMPASYTLSRLSGVDPANYERHPLSTFKGRCGVPYEWLIDLCNVSGKDAWLQVPHTATSRHIIYLATLVSQLLDPAVRVWFEYSNELWNNIGPYQPQYQAALEEGTENGQSQAWGSGHLQARALRVFEAAWRQAGGTDDRLINVFAGFQLSPAYNAEVLAGAEAVQAGIPEVLAVTTYFGAGLTEELYALPYGNGNPGQSVYEDARECIRSAIYRDLETWQANGNLCHDEGIGLIAYEGGSHILATGRGDWDVDGPFMRFLENLHKHPVMKEVYLEHWAVWCAIGGRTASLFVDIGGYGYYGYWGAKEDVTETPDESPRWDALQEYATLQDGIRSMNDPLGARPAIQANRFFRGEAGLAFSQAIAATGGDGALTMAILGGRIPSGTAPSSSSAANSASLSLGGTPSILETARFVVRASDSDGDPDYAIISVAIDPEGTTAGGLALFDPAEIPSASLQNSENNEGFRTRFDIVRAGVRNDTASASHRIYLPFDPDAPMFGSHYLDHSLVIPASSGLNPSGGWSLAFLVAEFDAANSVDWSVEYNAPTTFYGLRDRALSGWVGSSLDLPPDASHPEGQRFGVPTVFDGILLWRKDQMGVDPGDTVSFGAGSQHASLIMETEGIAGDEVQIRFVIRARDPGGLWRYYLSEASYDEGFSGRFTLVDFDANATAGKRWALFSPDEDDFALPDPLGLVFTAVDFTDIDRAGVAFRSYRGGWHYGFTITRFLAVGVK
jgi:hypothetical protein